MAITLKNQTKKLNAVELILNSDDAVDQDGTDWEKFDETLDLSHIKIKEGMEPTIFLCNYELSAKMRAEIEDAMVRGFDEDGGARIGLSGYYLKVVKYTLKDIKNPASVPEDERLAFKKHGDGSVSDETLNMLARLKIIKELAAYYTNTVKATAKPHAKN